MFPLLAKARLAEEFSGTGNSYGPIVSGFHWRDAIVPAEHPPEREGLATGLFYKWIDSKDM